MNHKLSALIIAFFAASPAFAESFAFEQDKRQHFAVGMAVSTLATVIAKDRAVGIGAAAMVGVAKELYDRRHHGIFSKADLAWGIAGGFAGAYIGGLIITPRSVTYSMAF